MTENQNPQMPTPDPALRALDRFVGTWRLSGHFVGPTRRPSRRDDLR